MAEAVPVVQSVDRAVAVMEILAREGWAGVTEIARELDIHKSTVFRLLATLERRGMVEKHGETQKYRLGFGVMRLASTVRASLDVVRAARPICDRLSRMTEETVNIAVFEDGDVVNIHQVNLSSNRVTVDWLGSHTPLHATSSGKVLLAGARPEERAARLALPLAYFTTATITSADALLREIDVVVSRGFAVAIEELEEGLNAVAAPIHGPDGEVVASVSVSGPSYRLEPERLDEVGALVVRAAADISRRLGHVTDASESDPPA